MTTFASPRSSLQAAREAMRPLKFTLHDGARLQQLACWNFAGPNYPTLHDELMTQLLCIAPTDRVVDIGGGDAHFSRADVVTDAFPDNNAHRSGRALDTQSRKVVECFAESLPFADQEFDFAYCRMVLEHTIDPAAACREMMRVAKRGFFETPSPLAEYLGGHPTHRWIVALEPASDGEPVVVFRRRPFLRAPFHYALRGRWFTDPAFRYQWEWNHRNLLCTQLAWEGSFRFRVEETADGMDFDKPLQASESHLDTALQALRWGDVPFDVYLPDIEEALRLRPEWPTALNARGCALWRAGRRAEAAADFARAAALAPEIPELQANQGLGLIGSGQPALLFLPDTDPVPASNFAGRSLPRDAAALAGALQIGDSDRVLDIYGAESPLAQATSIAWDACEGPRDPAATATLGALPFPDGAFDLAICRSVLASAPDPAALCRELQRVARRGFLEAPALLGAAFCADPTDRWLVSWDEEARELLFRPRRTDEDPFGGALLPLTEDAGPVRESLDVRYRNLAMIQISWDEARPFTVRVEGRREAVPPTPNEIASALGLRASSLLAQGLPTLALREAGRAMRALPGDSRSEGLAARAMEQLRSRGFQTRADTAKRAATDGADDLNADGSRWEEIYDRIPIGDIPAHYSTFVAMPFLADYLSRARALCPVGGRALETGVGFGYGAIWLSLHGIHAEGIDYAPAIVERGSEISRRLGGSAQFRYGDMFRLAEAAPGPYDLIFHQGCMEHFSDDEIHQILRQQVAISRRVLFSVPSAFYPFEREYGNERLMTTEEWRKILAEFEIEDIRYYGHPSLGGNEQIMVTLRGTAVTATASTIQNTDVVWNAPLREPCGYADEARHFLFALESAGRPVAARAIRWSDRVAALPAGRTRTLNSMLARPAPAGAIQVQHTMPPAFAPVAGARASIGRTMFETDALPAGWAEACNRMDLIWVPGEFNRATFSAAGVQPQKLRVVPGTIDLDSWTPSGERLTVAGARGYNFLSVFDWTLRKGWDVLLRAFCSEFQAAEDVALILKIHSSSGRTVQSIADEISAFLVGELGRDPATVPDIILQDGDLSDEQMRALTRAADCFVLPSRGEGWGRPIMEAMAMARPAIATGWSGQTAFMTSENSLPLDYQLVDVSEAGWRETPTYRGHRWAEPSASDLATKMRVAFEERARMELLGAAARAHLEEKFSYRVVAEILCAEIERAAS